MLATIFISHLTILGLSYKSIQSYQRKWSRDETWVKFTTYFHEYSKYESTNFFHQDQILCNICFDFLTCSKLRKKCLFCPIRVLLLFFNWEIWVKKFVDSHSENSWKHVVISIIDESSWSSFPCGFHCLRKSLCKTFVDHGNRQTQKGISKLAKGRVSSRFEF